MRAQIPLAVFALPFLLYLIHLGFQWNTKNNNLNLGQHKKSRISELWSVTTSLITSGVRHCHPDAIVSLFTFIILLNIRYGLELVDLTKTEQEYINARARSCLKLLFNVLFISFLDIA